MLRLNIHQKAVKRAVLSQLELYYHHWEMRKTDTGVTIQMSPSERKMHLEEMKLYYSAEPQVSFDEDNTTFYWV